MRMTGKVALVSGAASGMGETHARRIIAEGGYLLMSDIAFDAGDPVVGKLPVGADGCAARQAFRG